MKTLSKSEIKLTPNDIKMNLGEYGIVPVEIIYKDRIKMLIVEGKILKINKYFAFRIYTVDEFLKEINEYERLVTVETKKYLKCQK